MSDSPKPSPHVIRLRGPWEIFPLSQKSPPANGVEEQGRGPLPSGARLQMPADWSAPLGREFCGQVRHQRFFHCPTGLGAGERVWLVCDGATDVAAVTLNDHRVGEVTGPSAAARFDVTELLKLRNELLIDVTFPAESTTLDAAQGRCGGLTGEVRLEIYASSNATSPRAN